MRDITQKFSYHKDHGHKTENYKTLKLFLERFVEQGHLAKYMKPIGAKDDKNKSRREGYHGTSKQSHGWRN